MKWMGLDWKFFTTSVIALAALAASIYFPQSELNGHSLTARLISSSALQVPADSKIQDLQITVNGRAIASPYISSLILINTGSKPISSADFESPLVLSTRNDSTLITAQITGSEPADIPVKTLVEDGKLKILPFLSNPKDQIKITLVSSGGLDLVVKARIAGVKEITYEDMTQPSPNIVRAVVSTVLALASVSMYAFFFSVGPSRPGVRVDTGIRLITVICLAAAAVTYGSRLIEFFGNGATAFVVSTLLFVCGSLSGVYLGGRNRRRYGD
ncbi:MULTISPECIES: hypothetical protein [Pseudomonas]|uniref:Uncharacterized protein n=1 Tax=Pseudomonas umsongensis TaxID=198618 RepID=A0ACC5M733_9PSED|nr:MULTISPECIES: hypothetical protein [Pseudomonas]MBB2884474.1 hypothetical protein [Pseudomonas umsongensis]NMN76988.1 hypothetical protein [Pseudomonas sp. KD5]